MARTDEDTWDLAVSVGATATVLAVRRALASWYRMRCSTPVRRAAGQHLQTPGHILGTPSGSATTVDLLRAVVDAEAPPVRASDPASTCLPTLCRSATNPSRGRRRDNAWAEKA